jgi:hypothetical protein
MRRVLDIIIIAATVAEFWLAFWLMGELGSPYQ